MSNCFYDNIPCPHRRKKFFTKDMRCGFLPSLQYPIFPCIEAVVSPGFNPKGIHREDKISIPTPDAIGVLLALHEILICVNNTTHEGRCIIRNVEQIAKIFQTRNL